MMKSVMTINIGLKIWKVELVEDGYDINFKNEYVIAKNAEEASKTALKLNPKLPLYVRKIELVCVAKCRNNA